jgi:release factor glutamine methyltransferase
MTSIAKEHGNGCSEWHRAILNVFDRMRAEQSPYHIECSGKRFIVLPNVYSPKFFTDSLWFAEELPKLVNGSTLLEIGTGIGIVAVFCALAGAKVVATDINQSAVRNARLNAEMYEVDISVRLGNLFGPIKSHEKFDFIFWNHPFQNSDAPVADVLLKAAFDYKYKSLEGYIRQARQHLSKDGTLLLGTGDRADLPALAALAEENDFTLTVVKEAEMPLEDQNDLSNLNRYIIYRFVAK